MRLPARIHVRLLGGFEIALDDTLPIRLSTKKVCGLVAFLVTNRKQAATREELATLLWGSCSDQQARQSLRQALLLLRKDLGSTTALASDKEVIRLQPRMWSADSLDFEKLAASGTLADAERAAELYHGDFLAGLSIDEEGFEEWLQAQRSRLQMAAGRVLAICAERRDAAGNGPGAIAAAERLLTLDPLREDWQRLVLRLTARYHGQHEALARATEFEALLRRELDVDPEPETAALIAKIGRGDIVRASAATGEAITHRIEAEGPASAFRAAGAQPDAGTALPAALLPRRRWQAPRLTSGRGIAAGSAIALLALTGAALTWTHAGKHPVEAVVTAPDPWQSPSPTARPVVAAMSLARAAITPIAVLPFVPYGESAGSMQLTADMITDDLVNMLSHVPGLRVISRQTSRSYQGQSVDVAVIGRELGVRYVLEGSVRRNDDKLRINVELVEAESRLQAWSGRIERADADRDGVLDEIVGRLARELQFEVAHAEDQRSSRKPGVEELIFKGWAALYGAATPGAATFRKAEAYFMRALERDPDNVRARIGLAGYHVSFQFHATDAAPHLARPRKSCWR
jgi:DNA-binding SARP family transcriptional activator/TolB-like protein